MPKRRSDHEGTREVLPSGLIRYRTKVNGRRASGSAEKTDKAAIASLKKAIEKLEAPASKDDRPIPSLAEYCRQTLDGPYRESVRNGGLAERTWELYEQISRLNVENAPLGALPIDAIEPFHIESWARDLITRERQVKRVVKNKTVVETLPPRPLSGSSKARYLGFLSGVFERARKVDRYLATNPVHDVAKPAPQSPEFRILTKSEVGELLRHAAHFQDTFNHGTWKEWSAHPRLLEMICLLGLHGLGPAEMCGVHKDDFDGDGLDIKRQARRGIPTSRLKTKNRKAWIAIDPRLASLLRGWPEGLVLKTKTGTAMGDNNVRRLFRAMVKGTKFEGLKPYDLRHTFAMRMLEEGIDIRTVSEQMRNTPEVVLKRYARSRMELKKASVQHLFEREEPTKEPITAQTA